MFQNIKKISIRIQLLTIMIFLVVTPVLFLGITTYNSTKKETLHQIENSLTQQVLMLSESVKNTYEIALSKVTSDLTVARQIFYANSTPQLDQNQTIKIEAINQITKASQNISIPVMKMDDEQILSNHIIVDKIKSMVGGTATIFQVIPNGLLRISTNVMKTDNTRAVGTYIPTDSPVYKTVMRGETFYGRAFVVSEWYLTAYEPIKDNQNNIIGALYVGVQEDFFQESLKQSLAKVIVGKTGYIYILNHEGKYLLSYKRQRDGENIWNAKDSRGNLFIQEIVNTGLKLKEGETGITYYPWKNKGETKARMKVAGYTYFPQWNWIVASSAYHEEFLEDLNKIKAMTIGVSIASAIIFSILGYFLTGFITKTLDSLIQNIQEVSSGNLTLSIERNTAYNSEFNQIIDAFVLMLEKLRSMVSRIMEESQNMATTSLELSMTTQTVNTSTENVSMIVSEIAKNSLDTNSSAQKSSIAAAEAADNMDAIKNNVEAFSKIISDLNEKTQNINSIVKVIENISKQTNLLALNAAVEAARAGEAGRGFTVVASEIRKLSEEVQSSTTKIKSTIDDIIKSVNNSMKATTEGTKQVEAGSRVIRESLDSLNDISEKVSQIAGQIGSISYSEQSLANYASANNATSIENISSSMIEISSISDNLASTAEELKQLVSQFKI